MKLVFYNLLFVVQIVERGQEYLIYCAGILPMTTVEHVRRNSLMIHAEYLVDRRELSLLLNTRGNMFNVLTHSKQSLLTSSLESM